MADAKWSIDSRIPCDTSHVNDAIDAPQNNLKGADCSTCEVTEEDYIKGGVWFLFFKVKILLELMF